MSHHSPITADPANPTGRFMSMVDVEHEVALSKATINRLHRTGRFPQKRHLSERRIGWYESDIRAWQASRASPPRPADAER